MVEYRFRIQKECLMPYFRFNFPIQNNTKFVDTNFYLITGLKRNLLIDETFSVKQIHVVIFICFLLISFHAFRFMAL